MQALEDFRTRGQFYSQALITNGDLPIISNSDFAPLTKYVGPPRTGRRRTQSGALVGFGLVPGRLWGGADLAMFFHPVVMFAQRVHQRIGQSEFTDVFGNKKRGQALLPKLVSALDFSFGLRGGGIAKRNSIKTQGRA